MEANVLLTCTRIRGLCGEGKGILCIKWDMCLKRRQDVRKPPLGTNQGLKTMLITWYHVLERLLRFIYWFDKFKNLFTQTETKKLHSLTFHA